MAKSGLYCRIIRFVRRSDTGSPLYIIIKINASRAYGVIYVLIIYYIYMLVTRLYSFEGSTSLLALLAFVCDRKRGYGSQLDFYSMNRSNVQLNGLTAFT